MGRIFFKVREHHYGVGHVSYAQFFNNLAYNTNNNTLEQGRSQKFILGGYNFLLHDTKLQSYILAA